MALTPRFRQTEKTASSEGFNFAGFKKSVVVMLGMVVSGGILTWIFITDGIRDISFNLANQLEPLYLADIGGLNEQQIGVLSSFFNVAMMIAFIPAGWLASKISERKTIIFGFLVQFIGFVVFLISSGFSGFAVSWFVLGIGFALVGPSFDSLISKAVPEQNRGLAYGLFWTSISLLALPAPYLGGLLWDRFTPRTPFIITTVVVMLSIIPVWFKFRLPEPKASTGKFSIENR
jgi:MFS family permease